jgi:hypothetical protein
MGMKVSAAIVFLLLAGPLTFAAGPAFAADTIETHCVNQATMALDARAASCQDYHNTIGEAVTHAASGETVFVGAGTYNEQVVIAKPLTLEGAAGMTSVIQPANPAANTTNIVNGAPIAAIVLVSGTTGVEVSGFTIDGFFASGCSARVVGVFYRGSSGSIQENHVENIAQGCNTALAIFVQTDKGGRTTANVAIIGNLIEAYGKNGITASQAGAFVTVNGNTVTGSGPLSNIVQNGVQIGYGARGVVTRNAV